MNSIDIRRALTRYLPTWLIAGGSALLIAAAFIAAPRLIAWWITLFL